jgi:GxxExxY protein
VNRETRERREKILFQDESYNIQGAIFEVYRQMGCGFLEAVYQECLEREFQLKGIPFVAQQELQLFYKNELLRQIYKPDFICYSKIIVEIKAVSELAAEHQAQILNYLKATSFELGLLVNFGSYPKAQVQRIANSNFLRFSRGSRSNNEEEQDNA